MGTTSRSLGVEPHAVASDLNDLLRAQRRSLPLSANNTPIPPSDPQAAEILKQIGQGRSKEFERLLTVMLCNLHDGVPFSLVTAPLRRMLTHLEVESKLIEASRKRERGPVAVKPLAGLMRRETREQSRLDLAQLKLAESPESVEALREVVDAANQYRPELDALTSTCEEKLALSLHVAAPRKVYGARRGQIAVLR